MISRAVLCPSPPLLARELTGRDPAVPGLRAACTAAVAWLLEPRPQRVIVVGPAPATDDWDPAGRLDLSAFAPALGHGGKPGLPLSLGLGAMLLDQAGYTGTRVLQGVGEGEQAGQCAQLGAALAAAGAAGQASVAQLGAALAAAGAAGAASVPRSVRPWRRPVSRRRCWCWATAVPAAAKPLPVTWTSGRYRSTTKWCAPSGTVICPRWLRSIPGWPAS